jgi:hypothetical protein
MSAARPPPAPSVREIGARDSASLILTGMSKSGVPNSDAACFSSSHCLWARCGCSRRLYCKPELALKFNLRSAMLEIWNCRTVSLSPSQRPDRDSSAQATKFDDLASKMGACVVCVFMLRTAWQTRWPARKRLEFSRSAAGS